MEKCKNIAIRNRWILETFRGLIFVAHMTQESSVRYGRAANKVLAITAHHMGGEILKLPLLPKTLFCL